MSTVFAILLCAGSGTRSNLPYNKILHYVGHQTIFELSLDKLISAGISNIYVVHNALDKDILTSLTPSYVACNIQFVQGGDCRTKSVLLGLDAIASKDKDDIVVIHDCARPFVAVSTIIQSIQSTKQYGSGIACTQAIDTSAIVQGNVIQASINRQELYNLQTPQTFLLVQIKHAYHSISDDAIFTDDSSVFMHAGFEAHVVPSSQSNKKITTVNDICALSHTQSIGIGFDVHKLVADRPLILGGVAIPYHLGLLGHSDADVLTHAIIDALLSASNMPDIGTVFPDNDASYKDISSMTLLSTVLHLTKPQIQYLSCTIIAQSPKLAPFIDDIRKALAAHLSIKTDCIQISATTTEWLGIIGQGDAIAASAMCLLTNTNKEEQNDQE